MNRRRFLGSVASFAGAAPLLGCRGQQVGEVMKDSKKDLVGSHAAGAETYKPLIDEALGKLLARQSAGLQPASTPPPAPKRICFVGLENKSSEELGDFKEQIIEIIDTRINTSQVFVRVSRKFVEAGLREARIRPDELFVPAKQRQFLAVMEAQGTPCDYLLFASVTSGPARSRRRTRRFRGAVRTVPSRTDRNAGTSTAIASRARSSSSGQGAHPRGTIRGSACRGVSPIPASGRTDRPDSFRPLVAVGLKCGSECGGSAPVRLRRAAPRAQRSQNRTRCARGIAGGRVGRAWLLSRREFFEVQKRSGHSEPHRLVLRAELLLPLNQLGQHGQLALRRQSTETQLECEPQPRVVGVGGLPYAITERSRTRRTPDRSAA
jgi:hypothetical protein